MIRRLMGWFRRLPRLIGRFFSGFLMGDMGWATARLLIALLVLVLFSILSGVLWEREVISPVVTKLREIFLNLLPSFVFYPLVGLFTPAALRYIMVPLLALVLALIIGARYVQDIYQINSYRLAVRYLLASLFGISYPMLVIEDGKRKIRRDEENLLDIIGGPGYVVIRPGSVVLFEHLDNPSGVRADGMHFITRFETIKEIASLQDQHAYIDRVRAVTKDGVTVSARDVHYRYRLYASRRLSGEASRSVQVPYPYSAQAVFNMAYRRAVRAEGLSTWPAVVKLLFEGEIQGFIRQNQVDQVTAPRQADADPRGDIQKLYQTPNFRERLRAVGAELLWYGIGHIEIETPGITEQRISTWQAGWRGDAQVLRAYSEGVEQAYQEVGRAQAQAEILNSILYSLNDLPLKAESRNRALHDLFLLRIGQILDAMSEDDALDHNGWG